MDDPRSRVLASDADRERAVEQLRGHAQAGRLSPTELGERLETALSARTVAELAALFEDLPSSAGPRAEAPSPSSSPEMRAARRRLVHRAGAAVFFVLVCAALWVLGGADGHFWPVWVILASVMALAPEAWRVLGPARELSDDELRGRRPRDRHRRR
jgi:uncharacterized protein DUF1707